MIEWIKTIFKDRPDTSTPITAQWLNKLQDYMMQIGLIKDYVVDYGTGSQQYWEVWKSGKMVIEGYINVNGTVATPWTTGNATHFLELNGIEFVDEFSSVPNLTFSFDYISGFQVYGVYKAGATTAKNTGRFGLTSPRQNSGATVGYIIWRARGFKK